MIKITKAAKKTTRPWSMPEWHKLDIPHYGKRVEWKDQYFRFKALDKNNIVGVITFEYQSGVIYISSIIIGENSRGKGIGTMLINKAEEVGKKLGAHRMWLMTGKDWSENEFYKKLGFKKTADLPDFNFHKDFIIYTKAIN